MTRLAPLAILLALCAGCPPPVKPGRTEILKDVPLGGSEVVPHHHGHTALPAPPVLETEAELPLPLEGHNSKAQLERERALLGDAPLASRFERAFRLLFTAEKARRQPREARALLSEVLAARPRFAPALRGIAYSYVADGFQMEESVKAYRAAVEADETYGPAHYGLAFMLSQLDLEEGRKHFERAMALGVTDERGLGERFYRK